ncbi:MAG: 50S ribosomal protein L10 [Candidatus Sumerlaeia bacterium]
MPRLKRPQKVDAVAQMADKLTRTEIVIVAEYKGINVAEITTLRDKCREKKVEVKVFKNRLAKLALTQAQLPLPEGGMLTGQNLFLLGYDDPVAAAKIATDFAKANEKLVIKGGFFEGRVVDSGVVAQLALMPSFDQIMAQIIGGLKSPITQLVRNTRYPITYLARTLRAIGEKDGQQAA